MGRKKKTATKAADDKTLVIKRYGNRRLYNTETGSYVNYQDLVKLIRDGHDIQVIDSTTKADVTKSVLIQVILEEEKNERSLLPTSFLYQLLRSREETTQDFFKNYLASSFEAYMKTKEEFDKRFRGWLEMGASAPQLWEKFLPGAEALKDLWGMGNKSDKETRPPSSKTSPKTKR
jgi:polyhydroxyalkanoate synthesis repressor PhaR